MRLGAPERRLAVPGLGLLAVLVAVWLADARLAAIGDDLLARRRQLAGEIAALAARTVRLRDDVRRAGEHAEEIAALEAAGFTAPQDRLAASTAIEALGRAHGFARLELKLLPQAAAGAPALRTTPVEIVAEARFGPDLVGFLDALPGAFTGVALVDRLTIWAPAGLGGEADGGGAVTAEAGLSWHTLAPAAEPGFADAGD
jgi:hypothetical protein